LFGSIDSRSISELVGEAPARRPDTALLDQQASPAAGWSDAPQYRTTAISYRGDETGLAFPR